MHKNSKVFQNLRLATVNDNKSSGKKVLHVWGVNSCGLVRFYSCWEEFRMSVHVTCLPIHTTRIFRLVVGCDSCTLNFCTSERHTSSVNVQYLRAHMHICGSEFKLQWTANLKIFQLSSSPSLSLPLPPLPPPSPRILVLVTPPFPPPFLSPP